MDINAYNRLVDSGLRPSTTIMSAMMVTFTRTFISFAVSAAVSST